GKKRQIRKKKKTEYPKFFREGEALVKLGWSKREGKPYEHKAPRKVLRALVQALAGTCLGEGLFDTERLFPLKDPDDRSEVPTYQAYLALAWLRRTGLVVQHGRRGYSLPEGTDLERESDRLWNELPTRTTLPVKP